jgi:hypothetical protein
MLRHNTTSTGVPVIGLGHNILKTIGSQMAVRLSASFDGTAFLSLLPPPRKILISVRG